MFAIHIWLDRTNLAKTRLRGLWFMSADRESLFYLRLDLPLVLGLQDPHAYFKAKVSITLQTKILSFDTETCFRAKS